MSLDGIVEPAAETFARAEWVALFVGVTGIYMLVLACHGLRLTGPELHLARPDGRAGRTWIRSGDSPRGGCGMPIRRLVAGGLLAIGVVAAACGGSSGDADPSGTRAPATPESAPAADEGAVDTAIPGPEIPDPAATPARPEPADTAVGSARPEESSDGADDDRFLFLPADAEFTPDGDRIIREAPEAIPGRSSQDWKTNWGVHIIALDELFAGGPPRDGILPLDDPKFIDVAAADEIYVDNSPLIQFELNGDVRAYGLDILTWHEIVNDVVGGVPVTVTFCPLCNSAIAFDRRVGEMTLDFGTSGLLRFSDLVMWDRQTESLWQQIGGKAIVGDMVGARLTILPAGIVSWKQFRESFPDGLVLSRLSEPRYAAEGRYGQNPYVGYDSIDQQPFLFRGELDARLSPFERVVTLDLGDEFVAYPSVLLAQVRVYEDVRKGKEIAVFWTPGASTSLGSGIIDTSRQVGSTGVFAREVNGRLLRFVANPDDEQTFIDEETGSIWNIFGEAVAGPLAGAQLEAQVHTDHFWFAWAAFQPDTEVVSG